MTLYASKEVDEAHVNVVQSHESSKVDVSSQLSGWASEYLKKTGRLGPTFSLVPSTAR